MAEAFFRRSVTTFPAFRCNFSPSPLVAARDASREVGPLGRRCPLRRIRALRGRRDRRLGGLELGGELVDLPLLLRHLLVRVPTTHRDGGSGHFVECIQNIRELSPQTQIEILVPDFRGRDDRALEILKAAPPDVMNHNLETAPRLYKEARPGSDYQFSLNLLKKFKELHPNVPTKSGIMVGLGETDEEVYQVMRDMREHGIDMITIGQYLAPSGHHLPVRRYVHPDTFKAFEEEAKRLGFTHAAVGAMVRSSYHADQQAMQAGVDVGA